MSACYKMVLGKMQPQDFKFTSFLGGRPKVPAYFEVPICKLCGTEQTFFFQITFPDDHQWSGHSMVVFHCTSCWNPEYLIPEMLIGQLYQIEVPEAFLNNYQNNFRVLTFNVDELEWLESYEPKLQFTPIELVKISDANYRGHKIGGVPNWYLEDESPKATDTGQPLTFLLQFMEGLQFPKTPAAPGQMKKNYRTGQPAPSTADYYQLFLANNLYFFATPTSEDPKIYIITQA